MYMKGAESKAADVLSRRDAKVSAISVATPVWLEVVVQGYQSDESMKEILLRCNESEDPTSDYSVRDRVILYKGRVWVGANTAMQQKLLHAIHASATGGALRHSCHL